MTKNRIANHVKRAMKEAAQDPSKLAHKQLLENGKVAYRQFMEAETAWQRCFDAMINAQFLLEADPDDQVKIKQHADASNDYDASIAAWKPAFDAMMAAKARFVCGSVDEVTCRRWLEAPEKPEPKTPSVKKTDPPKKVSTKKPAPKSKGGSHASNGHG